MYSFRLKPMCIFNLFIYLFIYIYIYIYIYIILHISNTPNPSPQPRKLISPKKDNFIISRSFLKVVYSQASCRRRFFSPENTS